MRSLKAAFAQGTVEQRCMWRGVEGSGLVAAMSTELAANQIVSSPLIPHKPLKLELEPLRPMLHNRFQLEDSISLKAVSGEGLLAHAVPAHPPPRGDAACEHPIRLSASEHLSRDRIATRRPLDPFHTVIINNNAGDSKAKREPPKVYSEPTAVLHRPQWRGPGRTALLEPGKKRRCASTP